MAITIKVELNHKPNKEGLHTLFLRITENRKHRRVAIGYAIKKKDWNPKLAQVKGGASGDMRANTINARIKQMINEADREVLKGQVNNQQLSSAGLQRTIKGEANTSSFFDYAEKLLADLEADPKRYSTWKRYRSTIRKLRAFRTKHERSSDLLFTDITVSLLKDFARYCKSIGNEENTVYADMKTIRAILYDAIEEDLFEQAKNPFFKFKLKQAKVNRVKLTEEEIARIEALRLEPGTMLFNCRNYFLFAFYCAGVRVGDVITLTWARVATGRLEYMMEKTDKDKSIKLTPKALAILAYYRPKEERFDLNSYVFPIIDEDDQRALDQGRNIRKVIEARTATINENLKRIAKLCEIDKNLTNHISRHSFSDIARKKGISVYEISKLLGHSSLKITEAYLSANDTDATDSAIDKMFD